MHPGNIKDGRPGTSHFPRQNGLGWFHPESGSLGLSSKQLMCLSVGFLEGKEDMEGSCRIIFYIPSF